MTVLMRATEVIKRPVVTLTGEDVAQVKDIVYSGEQGGVAGFTLNGRGLLAGPSKQALPWEQVLGLGRDAVIIDSADVLAPRDGVTARSAGHGGGDVLGSRVLTDTGTDLGKIVEVILEVGSTAEVVGYEIESSDALGKGDRRVLIPLPDTLAVSAEALIVPDAATEYVTDDLSGFGAAVEAFRARLAGEAGAHSAVTPPSPSSTTPAQSAAGTDPEPGL